MRRVITWNICLEVFLLQLCALPAWCLDYSLSPRHYASAMEFYYKSPRPELLSPMLRSFSQARLLANGEKRMFTAAFLAALAKKGQANLDSLAASASELGRDARLTIAWSAHLAQPKNSDALLAKLLTSQDQTLASQIRKTPPDLLAWDPAWESSVLGMFWGSFMATGDLVWLDRIIAAALDYAAGNSPGGQKAAASLYEYAPRHPVIVSRLETKLANASSMQRDRLEPVLEHARGQN